MSVRFRSMTRLSIAASLVLITTLAPRCQASWAYVPQEIRIIQADLVVVGTIEKLGKAIKRRGRSYNVGVIKPTMILKGKPKRKGDIRVAWPAPRGGLRVSTDITFRVGQKGVWVLTADKTLPVYWATYPTDYQPMAKLAEMRKKLANVKNIRWGKAKNGLQVGLIVEQRDMRKAKVRVNGKLVKAIARLSVYPLLKNVSDKPTHVVEHYYDRPMSITFKEVLPGQVCTMGYGFGLPMCTKSGEYTITLSYKNKRDGRPLKINRVWQGQAVSTVIKVEVPEKAERK